jgi:2-oxoglutarate dehydrogenase E2 component (dihydrolipoamide succinyltransferase)
VSIEVKVPQLPESVADATLVAWHKKAGDAVRREENLVDLETDKVVLEVPAPADGVLREIVANDGAVVTSGQLLAILEPGSVATAAPAAKDMASAAAKPAPKPAETAPLPKPAALAAPAAPAQARSSASANKMGPAVRKLVEEHDLDPASIAGSGREGRITKGDVLDYIADHQATHVGIEHDVVGRAAAAAQQPAQPAPQFRAPRRDDALARRIAGFAASAATSRVLRRSAKST